MTYTVQSGDSLSLIAKKFTKDWTRWSELLRINAGKIRNPDSVAPFDVSKNVISAGMVLNIPAEWVGNVSPSVPSVSPSSDSEGFPIWLLAGLVAAVGYFILDKKRTRT